MITVRIRRKPQVKMFPDANAPVCGLICQVSIVNAVCRSHEIGNFATSQWRKPELDDPGPLAALLRSAPWEQHRAARPRYEDDHLHREL